MNRLLFIALAAIVALGFRPFVASTAADTFGMGANSIEIEFVTIGNPGNPGWSGDPFIIGAVGYEYRIGKYEVTNAQYAGFLNAIDPRGANILGLYNSNMSTSVFGGIDFVVGAEVGSKYQV